MTTASCTLATALWGARFAGVWLPSCYTTWGDMTEAKALSAEHFTRAVSHQIASYPAAVK